MVVAMDTEYLRIATYTYDMYKCSCTYLRNTEMKLVASIELHDITILIVIVILATS